MCVIVWVEGVPSSSGVCCIPVHISGRRELAGGWWVGLFVVFVWCHGSLRGCVGFVLAVLALFCSFVFCSFSSEGDLVSRWGKRGGFSGVLESSVRCLVESWWWIRPLSDG